MVTRRVQHSSGRQALKARATREKILNAVVSLINEGGYSAASSTAIARRAKITWGAVQHHFGSKDEILLAVVEKARDVYIESLRSQELETGTLEQKIDVLVDKVWEHYKSDLYVAFSEIIMATRSNNHTLSLNSVRPSKQLEQDMDRIIAIFTDQDIPKQRINEVLRFIHRFLAGFAMDRILEPSTPYEAMHINRIKSELLSLLDPA